jgi:drug/metabolite transporter (DMT)-like permease
LGNVFQKKLTAKNNHPLVVNFLTYLLLSVVCIFILISLHPQVLPRQFWVYSILAGIAGATGNGFLVKALHKGDLSVLGPVNSYKSLISIVLAIFLLKEIPGIGGIIGVFLIIYGSYFVLDTTPERFTWALLKKSEIKYRIWAMILTAIEAVFIKKIILSSSVTYAFISWCWFGALFSFLLLLIYRLDLKKEIKKSTSGNFSKYFFLVVCIGTMQFTTNYAFDHLQVGYALSLFQLSTLVSVFFGHRFFKEKNIRKKMIGTFIMITGSIIIILFQNH